MSGVATAAAFLYPEVAKAEKTLQFESIKLAFWSLYYSA
jgi:hypothetical protein